MGTGLIFPGLLEVTNGVCRRALSDWSRRRSRSRKQLQHETVPETDTGGLVEHTKALERTMLKELGKLPA